MRTLTLYTRPGCGACEEVCEELIGLAAELELELVEVDVSGSAKLEERFGAFLPVVALDGEVICELGLDRTALLRRAATFPA